MMTYKEHKSEIDRQFRNDGRASTIKMAAKGDDKVSLFQKFVHH
jgi:hypothetical protein